MLLTLYLNHFAYYAPKCDDRREFSGIPRSLYTNFLTVVPEHLLSKSGSTLLFFSYVNQRQDGEQFAPFFSLFYRKINIWIKKALKKFLRKRFFIKVTHIFLEYLYSEVSNMNRRSHQRCSIKKLFLKFRKINKKTPVPEFLFW